MLKQLGQVKRLERALIPKSKPAYPDLGWRGGYRLPPPLQLHRRKPTKFKAGHLVQASPVPIHPRGSNGTARAQTAMAGTVEDAGSSGLADAPGRKGRVGRPATSLGLAGEASQPQYDLPAQLAPETRPRQLPPFLPSTQCMPRAVHAEPEIR